MGNRLDALCPESLVELGVEADVGGAHRLLGKVNDGLDGPGSSLLEGAAVDALVEVDGVFAGHDILEGGARLAALQEGRWQRNQDADVHNSRRQAGELRCRYETFVLRMLIEELTFLVFFAEGA